METVEKLLWQYESRPDAGGGLLAIVNQLEDEKRKLLAAVKEIRRQRNKALEVGIRVINRGEREGVLAAIFQENVEANDLLIACVLKGKP